MGWGLNSQTLDNVAVLSFWFKYDLDRSTVHARVDPTGVRIHDLQIINSTFHIPRTFTLTTEPSLTVNSSKSILAISGVSIQRKDQLWDRLGTPEQ